MNVADFTFDMFKACSLKCTLKLAKHDGTVAAASGNWWVMPAKNESVWKYTRAAKKDKFDHDMRLPDYNGYIGQVTIGGYKFFHYPKGSVLVRHDFAAWCETNWHKVLKEDGTERESNKPLRVEEVEAIPVARHALDAKMRAKEMPDPTDLMAEGAWNTLYDMKMHFRKYLAEMEYDAHRHQYYIVTRMNADLLAAMISHKERNYPEAVSRFIAVAAAALKAAEYECKMHCKQKEGEK